MSPVTTLKESLRLIREDCRADAASLDGQPFTGRVVATQFGNVLAMVDALAASLVVLVDQIDAMESREGL